MEVSELRSALLDALEYDKDSGRLVWKRCGRKGFVEGTRAGSLGWQGYRTLRLNGKLYKEHRVIWLMVYGDFPVEIDHINGIRDDNRLSNLRASTKSQNRMNSARRRNNKSGVVGVFWCNTRNAWACIIRANNKRIWLGSTDDLDKAREIRRAAELKYFGEFRSCR